MVSETTTLITAIIGAVCGIVGAVLGGIGTYLQLKSNQLRIKVRPQHVIHMGGLRDAKINFSIDVINLSNFPVVIADVGFIVKGGNQATLLGFPGLQPVGKLPLVLESRTKYTRYFWLDNEAIDLSSIKCAYARTVCGSTVKGTSPALKQIITESGLVSET